MSLQCRGEMLRVSVFPAMIRAQMDELPSLARAAML
jgi:hypothetical protein